MPLQISSAAQHNLSESYRRYIELKRMPPAELPQQPSVADLTEQQLPRETIVEYLSHSVGLRRAWAHAKFSKATGDLVFHSLRNKPSEKLWKQREEGWELPPEKTEEQRPAAPAADKAPDKAQRPRALLPLPGPAWGAPEFRVLVRHLHGAPAPLSGAGGGKAALRLALCADHFAVFRLRDAAVRWLAWAFRLLEKLLGIATQLSTFGAGALFGLAVGLIAGRHGSDRAQTIVLEGKE